MNTHDNPSEREQLAQILREFSAPFIDDIAALEAQRNALFVLARSAIDYDTDQECEDYLTRLKRIEKEILDYVPALERAVVKLRAEEVAE